MVVQFRSAGPGDAEQVAMLHADSWRRHYRGAFADSFLDGDLVAERVAVWSKRLVDPDGTATILAEADGELVGFVHVMLDLDPEWGSLVDNLHVVHSRRRGGIGKQLLGRAAQAVVDQADGDAMYLWVLEQNVAAQQFYLAVGAKHVETAPVSPPGGDPAHLNGKPNGLRMAWADAAAFSSD
ncbi:GNAT family N-acetyltransferase [Kribbella sp. NPDC051620]|uniref:GNAT family N-acetyltransferase n=1 Tax=Kribbella sp. NPDC051620 TaxID=3364120 RepID=UPI00378E7052